MSGPTVSPDGWRKSSLSAAGGECVEFARSATGDALSRDSKDPSGGVRIAEFEV
ncbi:DUF397 domain-containing protein [Nonomuraea sp. NPDC049758]|uniref:DUF397 domain-containing protein n=1 Tax=Nonomuraea sp. NPDC049758 TaxID=3154360 RepID=UPI00343CABF0